MRKISVTLFAVIIGFVFLLIHGFNSNVTAQKQPKLILSPVDQIQADIDLANVIRQRTNRRSEGLTLEKHSDGSMSVDLQGRFQNLMLGKLNPHGQAISGCVASLNEANSFYGKDLETGQLLPHRMIPFDAIKRQATQHAMSKGEFLFYKNLIEKAERQRALNPNSATINIVNGDGAGEGFNDNTAATPEGGNSATTLGAQRLNVFNAAATIWGSFLDSSINIDVASQFDPLFCSPSSAVLGGASATTLHGNFANAIYPNTFYPQALANKQSGGDRSNQPDINVTFNSEINGNAGCLGGQRFYLGLDNSTPAGTSNLLITALHEIGHGLGFASFVDETDGTRVSGTIDVFSLFIFDTTTNKLWGDMSDAERMASAINNNNVDWAGLNVANASGNLSNGRDATNGRVELYTPSPVSPGSSVSHFNTRVFPSLLMEPNITLGLPLDLDLTRQTMRDIGWYRDTTSDVVADTITNVAPSGGSVGIGNQSNVTWTNVGGFDRNVIIELSTDGGATYPTVLSADAPNTGSFTFTVPNTPSNQAKVRVRENNFVEPMGESANNFTIGNATAPDHTLFDFDGDGKADVSIFRSGTSPTQWWYLRSSDFGNQAFAFGTATDTLVPADFTGDGKTDIAFWRESTGEWFVLRSEDSSFYSVPFGSAGDIPAPGDFDGDGKADTAVFRPSTATWFIQNSGGGTSIVPFGVSEDKPVVADYDGDGKDDIAIYRPSVNQWWLNRSQDGVLAYEFGAAGDKTVQGDFSGDGKADSAIFRPSSGEWFVLRSEDLSFFAFPFGLGTDIPTPGDYDGDGTFDAAVFRPSTNTWFINGSTSGSSQLGFGIAGDVPLPNVYSVP